MRHAGRGFRGGNGTAAMRNGRISILHTPRQRRGSAALPRRAMRAGFTLIEVLATLVLLGIILPAAMRGVSIGLAMASHARHVTEAAQLAEAKLNELVATG